MDWENYQLGEALALLYKATLVKSAASPELSYGLKGKLSLSRSGWLIVSVPNAIGRGAYDALEEHGTELPLNSSGVYNAHISVMSPDDIKQIGGPDKISERGHTYSYTTGPVRTIDPAGWPEMSRVWFIEVKSPSLETLRKSYGLPALPKGDRQFHISFAVRRRSVLHENPLSKIPTEGPFRDSVQVKAAVMYHGSHAAGLKSLQPAKSRALNGDAAVFGTPDRDVALSFAAPWRDDDFAHGSVNGEYYMREKYPGAFEKIFKNRRGSLYTAPAEAFAERPGLTKFERVSSNPVPVLNEEVIPDVLAALEASKFKLIRHQKQAADAIAPQPRARAVMSHGDQYLLEKLQNNKWPANLGKRRFPGGGAQPGETPAQALARELQEELGVQLDPATFEYLGTDPRENMTHEHYFRVPQHNLQPGQYTATRGQDATIHLQAGLPVGADYMGPDITKLIKTKTAHEKAPSGRQVKVAAADGTVTVAMDVDGTLATYDGWKGHDVIGAPREGAVAGMKALKAKGYKLIIHTCRGRDDVLKKWLDDNEIPYDGINKNPDQPEGSSDKMFAHVYADDRAVDADLPWPELVTAIVAKADKNKAAADSSGTLAAIEAARKQTEEPKSPEQAAAGNYKKGKVVIHGLTISIENPKGSTRKGVDKNGKPWSVEMKNDYGYFLGTKGKDKDHLDVFLGPNPDCELVFIIDQQEPSSKRFDEHKVVLGCHTKEEASAAYLSNYAKGWQGLRDITGMTVMQFKDWLANGDTTKPVAGVQVKAASEDDPVPTEHTLGRYVCAKCGGKAYSGLPGTGTNFRGGALCSECGYSCSARSLKPDGDETFQITAKHREEMRRSYEKRQELDRKLKQKQGQDKSAAWEVQPSQVEGYGLHAARDLSIGDVIEPNFMRRLQPKSGMDWNIYDLSPAARYTNHGVPGNAFVHKTHEGTELLAARAIKAGEEITAPYDSTAKDLGGAKLTYYFMGKPYHGGSSTGKRALTTEELHGSKT